MNTPLTERFARFLSGTSSVRFGDFTLKSGKKSKVFFNLGEIFLGGELLELGGYYAEFMVSHGLHRCDAVFGPAYKGINIAIATSIALHQRHDISLPFAYNRKTAKTHAEGGLFVGADLARAREVVIVDDVITDGGTKYEVMEMLSGFPDLTISAFIVGVDRQETNEEGKACIRALEAGTGVPVHALTTRDEVLRFGA
uniref:Orotate phosphoribosyltransferase n=1 Tax=Candidatus Kentrum sp. DK TaxID=2126562 RepID=A0A450SB39_9GAMM|nr:MAG: orotate phosphoribosyltransferase [Candidatus Kentron sp. DK]VFJ60781.1 MAG: orotate phosphoribosyltransferase [Candidatus Kentron sp. DK]